MVVLQIQTPIYSEYEIQDPQTLQHFGKEYIYVCVCVCVCVCVYFSSKEIIKLGRSGTIKITPFKYLIKQKINK